jgi:formylmethanofuran dehydrogenase subunit C
MTYRGNATVPLDVEGVTPDVVASLSISEIEQTPVYEGNRAARLADYFDIAGDPTDERIEWHGDLGGVHWIGAKMKSGIMHVHGSAGRHVGSEMSGGEIHVTGDAGDWAGAEMHGGLIRIQGSAGNSVGSAYRGSATGMTRGVLLIEKNAGHEVGNVMRRGLIAIGGRVGDLVGASMRGGTILMFGACGIRHGAGMRRGTLAFLGPERPRLLPSFRYACRFQPQAMHMLLRQMVSYGFPFPEEHLHAELDLFNGDLIEGGRGELLMRAVN